MRGWIKPTAPPMTDDLPRGLPPKPLPTRMMEHFDMWFWTKGCAESMRDYLFIQDNYPTAVQITKEKRRFRRWRVRVWP